MQEAALINVIKTILIIVLVYYAFRFISRILFPFFLKLFINRVNKRFGGQPFGQSSDNYNVKSEGDVTITYEKKKSSKDKYKGKNGGDYVDFEEIE